MKFTKILEEEESGVSLYLVLLSALFLDSGVNLGKWDWGVHLRELLGCLGVFRGQSFAVTAIFGYMRWGLKSLPPGSIELN